MGRPVPIAVLTSAVVTLVAAMALRASEAVVAVVGVAALAVLLAWFAQLHATDERGTGGLVNPASALALAVVGRRPWGTLLPAVAAHAVGGVVGGLVALALDDRLGETLTYDTPDLVVTAVSAAIVGLLVAWTTLAVDGGGPETLAAVPPLAAGAIAPLGLFASFHPAALIGLATADLLPWNVALVGAGASLAAAAVGAASIGVLLPGDWAPHHFALRSRSLVQHVDLGTEW